MAKMTVLYKTPKDTGAFDAHYFNVHVPLAKQLPGLLQYEVSRTPVFSPNGHDDTYLIGTLHFESMDAMKNAFASEQGALCAADRRLLAPEDEDVQIYLYETIEV
ncbi:MAG: EthD family reductase [Flavobacterium sp.]|nr:MAG: EthD family reductase [Flavobacterium sp.]